jgi:Fe2+ or Zn2+ uptake regulation protein
MPTDQELTQSLAGEIADYLGRNPQAADDIRGIMRWWLQEERRGADRDQVRAALALLEASGTVRRTALQDGHEIYSRAPAASRSGRQGCDDKETCRPDST